MMEEEEHVVDNGTPRIIDESSPAPTRTFQVIDIATNTIIRKTRRPNSCYPVPQHTQRPKLEELATLAPDEPITRQVDTTSVLYKLPDGIYGLRMESRGIWWCAGRCEDFSRLEGNDRVPEEGFRAMVPTVMLECKDVMKMQVEDGMLMSETQSEEGQLTRHIETRSYKAVSTPFRRLRQRLIQLLSST